MAPQQLEKIESAPGNGMVSDASKPQHLVYGADRAPPLRSPVYAAFAPDFTNL